MQNVQLKWKGRKINEAQSVHFLFHIGLCPTIRNYSFQILAKEKEQMDKNAFHAPLWYHKVILLAGLSCILY